MKWKKLGNWLPEIPGFTHAALPIYREGAVYFTARDSQSRSHVFRMNFDLKTGPKGKPDLFLSPGEPGSFTDSGVMGSWFYEDRFYVTGWNRGGAVRFRNAIGIAYYDSGIPLITHGPILDRNYLNLALVASACIVSHKEGLRMYHVRSNQWKEVHGRLNPVYSIAIADSEDGLNWNPHLGFCIPFQGEEHAIARPCVINSSRFDQMWYSYRGEQYRIGYAESHDGKHWTRKDHEAGIEFSENGFDSQATAYPFVFDAGERYLLYNGNEYGKTGFGLAILENA